MKTYWLACQAEKDPAHLSEHFSQTEGSTCGDYGDINKGEELIVLDENNHTERAFEESGEMVNNLIDNQIVPDSSDEKQQTRNKRVLLDTYLGSNGLKRPEKAVAIRDIVGQENEYEDTLLELDCVSTYSHDALQLNSADLPRVV